MNYKYQYKDDTEKQTILNTHKDLILVEEQNIMEDNFLVFSDIKPFDCQLKDLNVTISQI